MNRWGYLIRDAFRLALVIGGLMGAITGFWYLNEGGYFYHDKLTTIHWPSWTNGEYKECNSLNLKEEDEHPVLSCEDVGVWEQGKVFNVRFHGRTFTTEQQEGVVHYWRCRKNADDDDTTITCRLLRSQ